MSSGRQLWCHLVEFPYLFLIMVEPVTYYVQFYASLPVFFVVIQDFLSFGYCDALKDGLARTVKVFRNGARTSLLLSTGVPSMQT